MKPVFGRVFFSHAGTICVAISLAGCLAAFASTGVVLRGAESKNEASWRPLSLITGGKIDPSWAHVGRGGFVNEEGTLRTAPDPKGLGLLVYKPERFGNCQIRIVFKAINAKANSGVYVRLADGIIDQVGVPGAAFDRDAANKPSKDSMEKVQAAADREEGPWYAVHHGYEVQIADTGDELHRTGAIYSLAPSSAEPKPDEWRTMIITLASERVSVDLDGKRITNFDPKSPNLPSRKNWFEPKREPKRPEAGYIGLQNHDPGDIVWFKEVSVRALPASERNTRAQR